jgi:hypothetical protein
MKLVLVGLLLGLVGLVGSQLGLSSFRVLILRLLGFRLSMSAAAAAGGVLQPLGRAGGMQRAVHSRTEALLVLGCAPDVLAVLLVSRPCGRAEVCSLMGCRRHVPDRLCSMLCDATQQQQQQQQQQGCYESGS